ncbi:MAG: PEP/pyruvate-binding domain-containing protein [Trueperaceae bacterium]
MTPLVLALGDARAADPAVVGPKAAHLSALSATHPVPPGFCLTADAYRRAERAGGIDPELSQAIVDAYAQLVGDADPPPPVAVRSSALDEDGPGASFAGQHETILGVVGLDAVLEAITRTWASLQSDVALAYRRDHGLPEDGLALAVLVQQLVVADASGVAFSVDPVSGRRDRMIVNATWGLGESLVAGHVTPDGWTLDKEDLRVVEARPSAKDKMTVLTENRTVELAVPTFLRERPALTDADLAAVAELTRDLEVHQGWPVDVEFALADGELFLLQCRPVTALPDPAPGSLAAPDDPLGGLPAPWREPDDAERPWERDRVHFPGQITMLDQELAHLVYDVGITHGLRTYGTPAAVQSRRFWTHFYASRRAIELPEAERAAWRMRGEAASAETDAGLANVWAWRWRPEIEAHLTFWDGFDLGGADDEALRAHLDATYERLLRLWQLHFEISFPAGRARGAFVALYGELFDDASELDAAGLLQGRPTLTTRAGEALWAVRDAVAAVPGLSEELVALRATEVAEALARRDDAADARHALDAYLEEFGRRTLYVALSAPSLLEDPTPVIAMLQDALRRPGNDARTRHAEVAAEGERRVAAARERLRGYPEPVRAAFEHRLAAGLSAFVASEDHNFLLDYGTTAAARRVVLEVGRRLADAATIVAPEDVVHLTWDELRATWAASPPLDRRALIAERQLELRQYADVDPPETVGATRSAADPTDDAYAGRTPPETREPDVVTGAPGARGLARGRARVLRDLRDTGQLRPGEILVATTTSPPWTPLFAIAAGLVTDTGGVLSHTAVIAREYGLPAVVGTGVGTRRLRDGMLLEVDGDRGQVRIVHEA